MIKPLILQSRYSYRTVVIAFHKYITLLSFLNSNVFPHGLDNTIFSSIQNTNIHFCLRNQIVGDKIGVTCNQIWQLCCLLFILSLIQKLIIQYVLLFHNLYYMPPEFATQCWKNSLFVCSRICCAHAKGVITQNIKMLSPV